MLLLKILGEFQKKWLVLKKAEGDEKKLNEWKKIIRSQKFKKTIYKKK